MLNTIIAKCLQISKQSAQALLNLLSLEKHWQVIYGLEKTVDPKQIATWFDFMEFLQTVGQNIWFKGHDRSKFPVHLANTEYKARYWQLFTEFGMTAEKTFAGEADYFVVLGSSEDDVKRRTALMIKDLEQGKLPSSQLVFGCGGGRELSQSILANENEQYSIKKLTEKGLSITEINMVSLMIEEELRNHQLNRIKYVPIDLGGAKTRSEEKFATTADSVRGILNQIETLKPLKPVRIRFYTNQPYAERQERDIKKGFEENDNSGAYQINTVACAYEKRDFFDNSTDVNIFLGEIARIINIQFKKLDKSAFNIPLTLEEQQELNAFITNNTIEEPITLTTEEETSKETFKSVFSPQPQPSPEEEKSATLNPTGLIKELNF